jgi:hypothetical protein
MPFNLDNITGTVLEMPSTGNTEPETSAFQMEKKTERTPK